MNDKRESAIRVIRQYLCEKRRRSRLPHVKRKWEYEEEAYTRYLCRRLIEDVCRSEEDPILVIRRLYWMLDDVLSESDEDHFITHSNCSRMLNIVGGILERLRKEERRRNEL